jgi:hypothetical protein
MAIKFEKIQAGMTLYDRRRHKMGNTTMSTIGEWNVRVISVDVAKREALVSWNGNAYTTWSERRFSSVYDWSMRDKDQAIVSTGAWNRVLKVTRRKPCPTCRARHASEECTSKAAP